MTAKEITAAIKKAAKRKTKLPKKVKKEIKEIAKDSIKEIKAAEVDIETGEEESIEEKMQHMNVPNESQPPEPVPEVMQEPQIKPDINQPYDPNRTEETYQAQGYDSKERYKPVQESKKIPENETTEVNQAHEKTLSYMRQIPGKIQGQETTQRKELRKMMGK